MHSFGENFDIPLTLTPLSCSLAVSLQTAVAEDSAGKPLLGLLYLQEPPEAVPTNSSRSPSADVLSEESALLAEQSLPMALLDLTPEALLVAKAYLAFLVSICCTH